MFHLSVTFKLAYKLDIESYHGLKVIAVPLMPLYFPRKSDMKFRITGGKSKFTIYIFQYNVCIFYNELQNIGVSFFLTRKKSDHTEIRV